MNKVCWPLVIIGVVWLVLATLEKEPVSLTDKEFILWLGSTIVMLGLFWRER